MSQIANVGQAAAWDGDEGTGWAAHWERYDASIRTYREPMLTAAAIHQRRTRARLRLRHRTSTATRVPAPGDTRRVPARYRAQWKNEPLRS